MSELDALQEEGRGAVGSGFDDILQAVESFCKVGFPTQPLVQLLVCCCGVNAPAVFTCLSGVRTAVGNGVVDLIPIPDTLLSLLSLCTFLVRPCLMSGG